MSLKGKKKSIDNYYKADRLTLSPKEAKLISSYYYNVTEQNNSSDKALGTFLHYARYSRHPGIPVLSQLHENGQLPPTTMWYGDKDWMDNTHAREELEKHGLLNGAVDYKIIPKSGH
jgi:hypothetical protein